MEPKLEKNIDTLFGIFPGHKRNNVINYYQIKYNLYLKSAGNELAKKYATTNTIINFVDPIIKSSIEIFDSLKSKNGLLPFYYNLKESPTSYYSRKCQEYVKIDEKDDIFAHALIDTYIKFIKYGENKNE